MLGLYARENDSTIVVQLLDEDDNVCAEAEANVSDFTDCDFNVTMFDEKIMLTVGEKYGIRIMSEDVEADLSDAFAIIKTAGIVTGDVYSEVDDVRQENSISLKILAE